MTAREWLRERVRWRELDKWKAIVEIVAVIFTGTWTFYEFSYKNQEATRRHEEYGWMSVDLSTSVAPLSAEMYAVHATVNMTNTSKRPVSPLFISWIVSNPTETDPDKKYLPVRNSASDIDMSPGEEVRSSVFFQVPRSFAVALIKAKIYMKRETEDELCIFDPSKHKPPFDPEHYSDVPFVCLSDSKDRTRCSPAPNGCPLQPVEALVVRPKQPGQEDKHD